MIELLKSMGTFVLSNQLFLILYIRIYIVRNSVPHQSSFSCLESPVPIPCVRLEWQHFFFKSVFPICQDFIMLFRVLAVPPSLMPF